MFKKSNVLLRTFFSVFAVLFFIACSTIPSGSGKKTEEKKDNEQVIPSGPVDLENKTLLLEDVLSQKLKSPNDILKWLKKCSSECQPPDRDIAKDLADGYSILFSAAGNATSLSQMTAEQRNKVAIGQSMVRKAFFKILTVKEGREILETAYRELSSSDSLYEGAVVEVENAVIDAVERLKKNPKTLANAWYLKAISTVQSPDNVLEMIEDYKNCILANSEDLLCHSSYEDLVHFYERPRCQEPNFSSEVSFESKKKNILQGADLLEATLEVIGPEHWEIWFTLKTFSAQKLEDFTSDKEKKRLLVLMVNGKELSQAAVNKKITDGTFRMIFQNVGLAQEAFDKICKKPNPEQLPQKLKL
jgi:preprotein translocase subunit SecD